MTISQSKLHANHFKTTSDEQLKSASSIMSSAVRLAREETISEAKEALRHILDRKWDMALASGNDTALAMVNVALGNEYTFLVRRGTETVLIVDVGVEFRDNIAEERVLYDIAKMISEIKTQIDVVENYTAGIRGENVYRFKKVVGNDDNWYQHEVCDELFFVHKMLAKLRSLSRSSSKFMRIR